MTLAVLQALLDSGLYHHATYRNLGTLWEGLHIYVYDAVAARGFTHAGAFLKDNPELAAAEELVRHTGVSVGAYGRG